MVTNPLYVIARTVALAVLFSVLGYVLLRAMPGEPLDRMLEDNPDFTFEDYMRLRGAYGLDDAPPVAYLKWIAQNAQGQWGYSRQYKIPVANLVLPRLQNTLILVFWTVVCGLAGALILGALYALTRHWLIALPIRALAWLGGSLPAFWLGLMMIVLFSVNLHWMPPGGIMSSDVQPGLWNQLTDRAKYLVMPIFVLALTQLGAWIWYALNNFDSAQ